MHLQVCHHSHETCQFSLISVTFSDTHVAFNSDYVINTPFGVSRATPNGAAPNVACTAGLRCVSCRSRRMSWVIDAKWRAIGGPREAALCWCTTDRRFVRLSWRGGVLLLRRRPALPEELAGRRRPARRAGPRGSDQQFKRGAPSMQMFGRPYRPRDGRQSACRERCLPSRSRLRGDPDQGLPRSPPVAVGNGRQLAGSRRPGATVFSVGRRAASGGPCRV